MSAAAHGHKEEPGALSKIWKVVGIVVIGGFAILLMAFVVLEVFLPWFGQMLEAAGPKLIRLKLAIIMIVSALIAIVVPILLLVFGGKLVMSLLKDEKKDDGHH